MVESERHLFGSSAEKIESILATDLEVGGLAERIIKRIINGISEKEMDQLMSHLEERILQKSNEWEKMNGDDEQRAEFYKGLIVELREEEGRPLKLKEEFLLEVAQVLESYRQNLALLKDGNRAEKDKLWSIIRQVLTPRADGQFFSSKRTAKGFSYTTDNAERILLDSYQRSRKKVIALQPEFEDLLPSTLAGIRKTAHMGYHAGDFGSKQSEHFKQRDSHIENYRKALESLKREKERLGGSEAVLRIVLKGAELSDRDLRLLIIHLYLDPNLARDEWRKKYDINFNSERSKKIRSQLAEDLGIELPDLRTLRGLRISGQLE